MPPLKYENELRGFSSCPPIAACEEDQVLYRWVFADDHGRSFLPVAIADPGREAVGPGITCTSWGLSFFSSKSDAKSKWRRLVKGRDHLRLRYGEDIATVQVTKSHGLLAPGRTHRNLFEYATCELTWTAVEPMTPK